MLLQNGNAGTMNGGSENDIVSDRGIDDLSGIIDDNGFALVDPMLMLGGDGADTIIVINLHTNQTIVGGNELRRRRGLHRRRLRQRPDLRQRRR